MGYPPKYVFQNNFKNLTCWMHRFIDSNHQQNNFDVNTLTAKKNISTNFGVWPCCENFDPVAYSTFGWRNVVHSSFCRLCSHSTSSQWWQCCSFRRKQCRTMRYPILHNVGLAKVAYYFLGCFLFFWDWCVANPTTQINSTSCFMCAPW